MIKSRTILTISSSDMEKFFRSLEKETSDMVEYFKKEYPESNEEFEFDFYYGEHDGRLAIVADVDEKWGGWILAGFLDDKKIPYNKEKAIYANDLKKNPYVSGDIDGFWVETPGQSIEWHTVGDKI